jgi:hypothetical protein
MESQGYSEPTFNNKVVANETDPSATLLMTVK